METVAILIIMRIEDPCQPLKRLPNLWVLSSFEHRQVVLVFTGVRQNNVYSSVSEDADKIHGETAEFWML